MKKNTVCKKLKASGVRVFVKKIYSQYKEHISMYINKAKPTTRIISEKKNSRNISKKEI
jgi:hypothetical protein